MSKIEKSTMQTTAVYNDDKTHRYLLCKEWNEKLPEAMVLMLSPSVANTVSVDRTTMLVLENLERLNYGKVSIVNLFSALNGKRTENALDDKNLAHITEAAERAQLIIYAVGTGSDGNKAVLKQQRDVLELLNPWKGKMQCIADANGKKFYHPLCPTVHYWRLEEFDYNELKAFNQLSQAQSDFKEVNEVGIAKSESSQVTEMPPKKAKRHKRTEE